MRSLVSGSYCYRYLGWSLALFIYIQGYCIPQDYQTIQYQKLSPYAPLLLFPYPIVGHSVMAKVALYQQKRI
jgi:hypothetical protein